MMRPTAPWDIELEKSDQDVAALPMKPGCYWFAITRRRQQTGWATPEQVAAVPAYNPYSDPYAVGARVGHPPITYLGLPPENYKETLPSQVIEIQAHRPWRVARLRLGADEQMRPRYFMSTPEGQNAQPFPIAPQTYYAFYVSEDRGKTWRLFDTRRPSWEHAWGLRSDFAHNAYSKPKGRSHVLGTLPGQHQVTRRKVFA